MAAKRWVLVQERLCFFPRRADQGLVAEHGQVPQVRSRAGLSGAHDVAFLAQAQIRLGQFEAVVRLSKGLKPGASRLSSCLCIAMHREGTEERPTRPRS